VNILLALIEFFSLGVTAEALWVKIIDREFEFYEFFSFLKFNEFFFRLKKFAKNSLSLQIIDV